MNKDLQAWLADDDDEDDVKPQAKQTTHQTPTKPTVTIRRKSRSPSPSTQTLTIPESDSPTFAKAKDQAARLKEAEERKRKQEELRERMKATLGQSVVDKVAEQVAVTAAASLKKSVDSDDSSNSLAGIPHSSANLPPVGPRSSGERKRSLIPDHLEEVELLVADRGTQTVEHQECQTDPEPRVLHCPQCFADYYGHLPDQPGCHHGEVWGAQAAPTASSAQYGMDPVFAAMMQRVEGGRYGMGSTGRRGPFVATPFNLPTSAMHVADTVASTAMLREQLNGVQSSIDALIARYNLPPPPGMEHLGVAR